MVGTIITRHVTRNVSEGTFDFLQRIKLHTTAYSYICSHMDTYGFRDFLKPITVKYDNIWANMAAYGGIWLHISFLIFK